MRARIANATGRRRRLLGVGMLSCAVIALALAIGLPFGGDAGEASGQTSSPGQQDTYQTDDALPAIEVMMIGASPLEAPAETWGIGRAGGSQTYVIVHYVAGSGWTNAPAILDNAGTPLTGFVPAKGVLAGQITPHGAGALAGFVGSTQVLLVRGRGRPFQETAPVPVEEGEEALLRKGEQLYANGQAPMIAALEEGEEGADAGALVVPAGEAEGGAKPGVLHWEGSARRWTREAVELPAGVEAASFKPIAIAASSPSNAWLLAHVSHTEAVSLFRRDPGSEGSPGSWKPVSPGAGQEAGAPLTVGGEPVTAEAETSAQALTVTGQGVWVDGERAPSTSLTLFFEPSSAEPYSGQVAASWCGSGEATSCSQPLPEELPLGGYRSFAWASESASAPYGERVITGFADGAILRLSGEQFTRVATVGGPEAPFDVGGSKGAAFSNAFEGWLGNAELPVHATLSPSPEHNLEYWPTPFHEPLYAIAAQPGVPAGPLTSEALAVGEKGEVARYMPAQGAVPGGWHPETLFEVAGRGEPQLRAVAWPTPNRAYAVGVNSDGSAAMWLWRGETGLWEPDPAEPVNLRANLLGIAFAPGEPSRGYAVGQGGTLLRYGKSWTQEAACEAGVPQPCLPAEVAGASFTAVTFAGAEALVAYRIPHFKEGSFSYTGGLLANDGSGWHVDAEVAAALGANAIPWTVAGLSDGGAAVSAANAQGLEPVVLERNSAGAAWEATPEPYPGYHAPASLALFREGGALRVVGAGAIPDTVEVDNVNPAPAGSPPDLIDPYPVGLAAGILRQSAAGWIDEEPERRLLQPPPGRYQQWDIPYSPDPTAAILLGENGSSGWAIGGRRERREGSDTADIARYPPDGSAPVSSAPVQIENDKNESIPLEGDGTENATFAVAGGGQCAAPCADLEHSGVGPDVWLKSALEQAAAIGAVRDFLYTGPRVTTGMTVGRPVGPVPYEREFGRYRALLEEGKGGAAMPVAVAASGTDLLGGQCLFEEDLAPFSTKEGLPEEVPSSEGCSTGQSAYYAFTSQGPPEVRVIVLDDSAEVGAAQLAWLNEELDAQAERKTPAGLPDPRVAIVLGSANLSEADAKQEAWAKEVTKALVVGGASAYLFDAPEENVEQPVSYETESIPTFGSGTLGYVSAVSSEQQDFIGPSGFLLVVVKPNEHPSSRVPNRREVLARLIPSIGELSLDADGGTLLRRSQAAEFSALARRPRAGGLGTGDSASNESDTFIPIPSNCQGGDCQEEVPLEYTFTSSSTEIGNFVEPNLQLGPEAVELNAQDEPIPDPKSGLFCAFNPGKTTVTISAGGRSASLQIEVQPGSVRRPCGTVPLHEAPAQTHERAVSPPVQPSPAASGGSPAAAPILPVPPPPAAIVTPPTPTPAPAPPAPLLLAPAPVLLPAVIVPPPLPPAAEPTPPSGTSAVTSPVEAAQREEEEEEATESVSAQAAAYHPTEQEPAPLYLIGLITLAAFSGATIRRARRGRREVRVAPATISTMRSQRRLSDRERRPW